MRIRWNREAWDDLGRLHAFLLPLDSPAAMRAANRLSSAPRKLIDYPRLGERIARYVDREVRRLRVGHYEMWYEIDGDLIVILRIWHELEDR